MKPTERLFEANFYSQVARAWHPARLTWFTPSTVDEADLGFDTFVDLGSRLFFFQFKHPHAHRTRRRPCGQDGHDYFQGSADHAQLMQLRGHAIGWPPGTFLYAMPAALTWADYSSIGLENLLASTYYMDVLSVPETFSPPTTDSGSLRKSGDHQLNLDSHCASMTLRSQPLSVPTASVASLVNGSRDWDSATYLKQVPVRFRQSGESIRGFISELPPNTLGLRVLLQ